jgi:hypothetical protein
MNPTKLASIGLAASLAAVVPAIPAQATLLTRTFVSSAGSNSNPCTITQPCASFQTAYSLTAPNGIVAALDPGKYGPLTITGPVSIDGNGWAAITGPASGNAITINAVSGNVALIGLKIDGAAAAYNGIVFNSGSNFTVTNCTLQNFAVNGPATGNGILIQPTAGTLTLAITNTTVSNNFNYGIVYSPPSGSPTVSAVIDHVVATANLSGIGLDTTSATGGSTIATISDSTVSNNSQVGILAKNGPGALKLSIDNVNASNNGTGISAQDTANVLLSRSVLTGNGSTGVVNFTSPNTFYTYQNNLIDLNGSVFIGSAPNTTQTLR